MTRIASRRGDAWRERWSSRATDGKLALTQPADHPKLEDYKVDDVDRGLELLTLQSVKPDAEPPATEAGQAVFTTDRRTCGDGPVFSADKEIWARFAAARHRQGEGRRRTS